MAAIKQPADKSHFILPDLGEGVHEAELISWKVKAGDAVKEHQTIVLIRAELLDLVFFLLIKQVPLIENQPNRNVARLGGY